jgi:uncharacterized membrane protein YfcA
MPDPALTAASFAVAVVVGLTGMGGGALMTPMLMFFFGIPPLAAVSSDLVMSAVTKPFGALVHLRKGTVDLRLVGWMCAGSVPCAFSGVFLARLIGGGALQDVVGVATGIVLLVAAAAIGFKACYEARPSSGHEARPSSGAHQEAAEAAAAPVVLRPFPTLLIGIVTGLGVGMTSVGSGSLVMVALTWLYPRMPARRLVGTDLTQAVPMVLAAAAAQLVGGDVRLDVTTALLVGGLPGVVLGSLLSSRAPNAALRPVLAVILFASGLKLVNLPVPVIASLLAVAIVAVTALALIARRRTTPDSQGEKTPPWPGAHDETERARVI